MSKGIEKAGKVGSTNVDQETVQKIVNREHWLSELAARVAPIFTGFNLGKYRLACGWPSKYAVGGKVIRLGECTSSTCSKDQTFEIFISPLIDTPLEVAGTTCHELAHVAAGIEAAHGPKYKRVCVHVGLTKGKPTVAMPGPALEVRLAKIIEVMGAYPHSAIVPTRKERKKTNTSKGLVCEICGCKVTISKKWLDEAGPPRCGCGGVMLEPE